jgi:hypothetical protein
MELAEGIRKIGFHRWYERQLLESCSAYGIIEVTGARASARHAEEDEGAGSAWSALGVRCRKCGHEWTIE